MVGRAKIDLRYIVDCMQAYSDRGTPIRADSIVKPVDKLVIQDAGPQAVGFAVHNAAEAHLPALEATDFLPFGNNVSIRWGHHASQSATSSASLSVPAVLAASSAGTIDLTDEESDMPHVRKELLASTSPSRPDVPNSATAECASSPILLHR